MSMLDCNDYELIAAAIIDQMSRGCSVRDNPDGMRKDVFIKRELLDDFLVCSVNRNTPTGQYDLIPSLILKAFVSGTKHGEAKEKERLCEILFPTEKKGWFK